MSRGEWDLIDAGIVESMPASFDELVEEEIEFWQQQRKETAARGPPTSLCHHPTPPARRRPYDLPRGHAGGRHKPKARKPRRPSRTHVPAPDPHYPRAQREVPRFIKLMEGACWRCGLLGHARRHCRNNVRLFCSRCGRLGVMSRDCPCPRENRARTRQQEEPSRVGVDQGVRSGQPNLRSIGIQCELLRPSTNLQLWPMEIHPGMILAVCQ